MLALLPSNANHYSTAKTMPALRGPVPPRVPSRRRASPGRATHYMKETMAFTDLTQQALRDENKPSASDPPLYQSPKRHSYATQPALDSWPPKQRSSVHPREGRTTKAMPPVGNKTANRPLPLRPLQLRTETQEPRSLAPKGAHDHMPLTPPGLGSKSREPGRGVRYSPMAVADTGADPNVLAPIGSERRRRRSSPPLTDVTDVEMSTLPSSEGEPATSPILSFGFPVLSNTPPLSPCSLTAIAFAKPPVLDEEQFRILSAQQKKRNPYAPDMMSPLNPLRALCPPKFWASVQTRKSWNFKRPVNMTAPARSRDICDFHVKHYNKDVYVGNQNRHCRGCTQDTVHKRLLVYNAVLASDADSAPEIIMDLGRTLAAEYDAMDEFETDSVVDIAIGPDTTCGGDSDVVNISPDASWADEWQSRIPESPRIVDLDSFDDEGDFTHSFY